MGKTIKRILASVLTAVMLISAVPLGGIESLGNLLTTKASAAENSETYATNKKLCKFKDNYYSVEGANSDGVYSIYKYDSQLKNKTKISYKGNSNTTISVYRNTLYFVNGKSAGIMKYDTDTGKIENIYSQGDYYYNISLYFYKDYYIVYDYLDDQHIFIYDIDTNNLVKDFSGYAVDIIDSKIYYTVDDTSKLYFKAYDLENKEFYNIWSDKFENIFEGNRYSTNITDIAFVNNMLYFIVGDTQGSGRYFYGKLYSITLSGVVKLIKEYVGRDLFVWDNNVYATLGHDGYLGAQGIAIIQDNNLNIIDDSICNITDFDNGKIINFNYSYYDYNYPEDGLYVYDLKSKKNTIVASSYDYLNLYKDKIDNYINDWTGYPIENTDVSVDYYYSNIIDDIVVFMPEICIPKGQIDNAYYGIYECPYETMVLSSEPFSENKYIADIWLDRRGGELTSESKLINDILSYDSISSEIYTSLRDDEEFQKSVNTWNGMEIVFNTVDGIKKHIDKKDVYETLILDLLEKVAKSQGEEVSNIILDVVDKGGEISGTVTKYKGIADKMVKIVDNPSTMLLDTLKEWKFDPQNCESFQKFYSSLNNIDDKASIWKDNKFIKGIGTIAEVATDVSDFFERFTGYMHVVNMSNEMVELLNEMYKHAETYELKIALTDIINSFKSTNYASAMLTIDLAGDLGFDVLDAAFSEVAKAIPGYNALRLTYGAAVAFDNLLFKTSETIDKYYLVKATYDFINSNKKSIDVLKNNYLSSNSDSDAGAYVYAVKSYHYVYEIDLESAVSFVKTTDNDGLINNIKCGAYGLWNLVTGSDVKTSYQSMCESKDSIVKSLNQLFYSLDNSWKFNEKYLKTDYPDVYPVYLTEELNKDEYTPDILNCYIEKSGKTSLSWSVPSMFFDKDGNCYPLYASIWIDGITATETVGTSANKYDYDDIYNAPNPMKLYNGSKFSTFSKKYSIAAYSTTDSGKVYTKSASYTLENPLKKANISLSVGRGSLSTLGKGITISISDPTSSLYPFVKYNIYRKTNDSSWSLLKTIDKDTQIRGMRTFFCDDTVHSGNKYSYKIVSSLTFDNGVTLKSEESNILTVGSKSETPVVSDVRLERFNKTVAFPGSYSAQTRAGDSDSTKTQNCIKLTWDRIEGAEKYEIYRKVSFGSLYNLIGTVNGDTLTYLDETTEKCCEYSYYVVPCKSSGSNEKIYDITGYATGEVDNKTLGDVNEDSKINSTDALLILQHSTGLITLSESKKLNADVTWDGKINSSDALKILQYSTGIIKSF